MEAGEAAEVGSGAEAATKVAVDLLGVAAGIAAGSAGGADGRGTRTKVFFSGRVRHRGRVRAGRGGGTGEGGASGPGSMMEDNSGNYRHKEVL